jgi:CheY-like chemotaxis protein
MLPVYSIVAILHIEDNPDNRLLVRAVLEPEGHHIIDAENGYAGIETAQRERPRLILLDVNLPGLDGCEVVARLKTMPELASTPVIALTAYVMPGDRERILAAGCDAYIAKPIDVDQFADRIRDFLATGT